MGISRLRLICIEALNRLVGRLRALLSSLSPKWISIPSVDTVPSPDATHKAKKALEKLDRLIEHNRAIYEESKRFKEKVFTDVTTVQ